MQRGMGERKNKMTQLDLFLRCPDCVVPISWYIGAALHVHVFGTGRTLRGLNNIGVKLNDATTFIRYM